jgi:flagellar motor switch protein FliM
MGKDMLCEQKDRNIWKLSSFMELEPGDVFRLRHPDDDLLHKDSDGKTTWTATSVPTKRGKKCTIQVLK